MSNKRIQKEEAKSFRLNTSQFFLTYPKCDVSKEDMYAHLSDMLDIQHYIIAREKHEDGTHHLHCWLKCNKTYNIKKADKFDFVTDDQTYHGNYQSARCNSHVIKYVTKDGDFISDSPKEELLLQVKARQKHSTVVGQKLIEQGQLTTDIIEQHPEILIQGNLQKIQSNLQIYEMIKESELRNKQERYMPEHYPFRPEEKQCHYWIYGERNTGKTSMWEGWQDKGARIYFGPYNNDWVGYRDQDYDIILFDEYKGQLTIQQLNALCDRNTNLNVKGGSIKKMQKKMVVVVSNYSIDECYKHALEKDETILETVHARFHEIRKISSIFVGNQ